MAIVDTNVVNESGLQQLKQAISQSGGDIDSLTLEGANAIMAGFVPVFESRLANQKQALRESESFYALVLDYTGRMTVLGAASEHVAYMQSLTWQLYDYFAAHGVTGVTQPPFARPQE